MFDLRSPIYQQIADQIRQDIVSGALEPGNQVMSTNQYASFHRINPATAAKAFQELVEEGLLEKRRGIGMFVTPGADERLRADRRARFVDDVVVPAVAEALRLGISTTELIDAIRSRSRALAQGEPA